MNQTDIHRKAIQRTFAELYSVPAESVDVVWNSIGVTVQCAAMIFTRQTGDDDHEFVSKGEDPVTATLTGDERYHLERRAGGLHGRILQTQSCPWIHFYPSLLSCGGSKLKAHQRTPESPRGPDIVEDSERSLVHA
jgi:hypothetical protein